MRPAARRRRPACAAVSMVRNGSNCDVQMKAHEGRLWVMNRPSAPFGSRSGMQR
jgi:hypothetical protein